jgi:hypothetical protein
MKSVKNEQVFDYLATSLSGWFEQRLAQYYNVLVDLCTIVATTSIFDRERFFFRNVFTEPIGVMGECIDSNASLILNDSATCVANVITADQGTADQDTADQGTADQDTADQGTADQGSSASTVLSGKNSFGLGMVLAVTPLFA